MKITRKNCSFLGAILCLGLISCGTSRADMLVDKTSIFIEKNGMITQKIVEDFEKEYYNVINLEEDIRAQIETIASTGITLANIEVIEDKVHVDIKFNDYELYELFNENVLFYGTVEKAHEVDFILPNELFKSGEDMGVLTEEILNLNNKYVIITNEVLQVMTADKISYYSKNCEYIDQNTVVISDNQTLNYIVLN